MQLGITIPLQKYLHRIKPPYGEPEELFFCWEVHNIMYQGIDTLVAVNCSNRFFVMLSGMTRFDWEQMEQCVVDAIKVGMETEGYGKEEIDRYFDLAGRLEVTKTHGRKPVAGLNKAIDSLLKDNRPVSKDKNYQPEHCSRINRENYRPACFTAYGMPNEFFRIDMERTGILPG